MDNVHQLAGAAGNFLRAVGHELTSVNLLLQLGLIAFAAAVATLAAMLIRRRINLTSR